MKYFILAVAAFCSSFVLAAPKVALDFGAEDSPLAKGFEQVTPKTAYDAKLRFGWIKAPQAGFDRPDAYPLDDASRDGVVYNSANPAVLRIDLPNGQYILEVMMGDRGNWEWRPYMTVTANGKMVISGLTGFMNTPLAARAEVTVSDGKLMLEFGNRHDKPVTGALNWLTITPRSEPMLQLRKMDVGKLRPAVRWMAEEKIRMYWGPAERYTYDPQQGHYVNRSEDLRRNIVTLKMNVLGGAYSRELGKFAAENKLRFFHNINYAANERYTIQQDQFIKNVVAGRGEDNRPSPLDANAWQKLAVDEARRAWRQSVADGTPLAGVLFDMEMYGAKIMEVYSNAATFDDVTWKAFWQTRPAEAGKLPINEPAGKDRLAFLAKHKLLHAYYQFMEEKMTAIASDVEKQIHAEAPDLLIGFLQYMDNWFFRGLVRGLGTESMPVIACSENTYYGYTFNAAYEYDNFTKNKQHGLFLPGLWPRTIHPRNLGPQIYAAGVEADGYWFYGHEQASPAIAPQLDQAIREANDKLLTTLASGQVDYGYAPDHSLVPLDRVGNSRPEDIQVMDPDQHARLKDPLPEFADLKVGFDFGQPMSAVKEGWTKVISADLFDAGRGWGWERFPRFSFNRTEHQSDPLLVDGIVIQGRNSFAVKMPAGKYKVAVILGDPAPGEWRTHQNVRVNGVEIARDKTTNGGEFRVFEGQAEVGTDGLLRVEFEGRGAQRYVTIHGVAVMEK